MLRFCMNDIESVWILGIKPADLGQHWEITGEKKNKDDNLHNLYSSTAWELIIIVAHLRGRKELKD